MAKVQYNRIIRKIVLGFGDLFNNITLVRYNLDETEHERFIIPINYGTKELYVSRLQGDPDLDKKVQITLPRFSYILNGISYGANRKLNTNVKKYFPMNSGAIAQYNPVPYDFDFSLYLYVRNIEDGSQIIEHILPFFTPDYTINIDLIKEMGIKKGVPIILNSTEYEVVYEGNRDSDTRYVIWTLKFTAHAYLYGVVSNPVGLIRDVIVNIHDFNSKNTTVKIETTPLPANANVNGSYIYNTNIKEF